MYDKAESLGEAVAIALVELHRMGLAQTSRSEAHVILWELAKWQSLRAAKEAREILAEEVTDLARRWPPAGDRA